MMTSFCDVIRHFRGFGGKNGENARKSADVSKNKCQRGNY